MIPCKPIMKADQVIKYHVYDDLNRVIREVARLVIVTPTSERRNTITEANLYLIQAVDRLHKASEMGL